MKKLLLAGLAIATLAVAAVVWARVARRADDDQLANAQTARAHRRAIATTVKATGIIKPRIGAEVRVGSRVSGVVRSLYVRVGDAVERGQVLAEVDARDLEARRREAGAAVQVAEANRRFASAELRRKRELRAAQLIAAAELESAEQADDVARQEEAQAQAALDFANTQLGYARIVAPIGGVVGSVATQEGETVAASFAAPTFVTLVDLHKLEVRAYVDETDIGRIRIGQKARFTVDTYPGEEFDAEVSAIYPQAEIRDNVVNYITVLQFDPPANRLLRPEMTTTVRILLEKRERVLTVPVRAIRREGGRAFVLTKNGQRKEVKTGARDEQWVEIASGLRDGDEVVISEPATKDNE